MKQILLAGFSDFAGSMLASSVSCAMKVRGIEVKMLPKREYLRPLEEVFRGSPPGDGFLPYGGAELPGRVLVFCGIPEKELDALLPVLQELGVRREDLKAVLTPINRRWNILRLAEELQKEMRAVKGR